MIGQTLGRYRILEKIGAGGMGEVYRARDERLGRDVAIKVLPAGALQDEQARKRFRREAETISKLNHPHIATVYDFDIQEGLDFLVMELVEGESLAEKLTRASLSEKEIAQVGAQIADALQEAHEHHVVHRDLKPGNIKLTSKGQVKILDFGLAKLLKPVTAATPHSSTEAQAIVGTMPYMSPEQLRGEPVDARSDLYSFGVVLYEMATGRRPFADPWPPQLMAAILQVPPSSPRALNRCVSMELERIILKCLEKDPENRYQSAHDLLADFLRLSTPSAAVLPVRRRRRYRPWLPAGGVTVVALLALFLGLNLGNLRDRILGRAHVAPIRSLAVLPLQTLPPDPEQEYFADGMTEALITELSKIGALKVISRTSVMRYKQTDKALPDIARELNVDGVIEGSVLREADQVRVTVQLIDASSDQHLWAESYQRQLRSVLALQSELARAVAAEIKVKVTPEEQVRLARTHPVDPEAYDLYVKGRYYWERRTQEALVKSLAYFQQAIEKDPRFALAYAGLADSYNVLPVHGSLPGREAFPRARLAATQALEIDDGLAEAHASLAFVKWKLDWDWTGADSEFTRALDLSPNSANSHHWYALYLTAMGRRQEGLREIKRAQELDPHSLIINSNLGWVYYQFREYDRALRQYQKTLEMDANFPEAHVYVGDAYVEKGMYEDAIAAYQRAFAVAGSRPPSYLGRLGYAHARAGNKAEAEKLRKELLGRNPSPSVLIAQIHLGLGDKDEALAWLEKAYQERSGLDLVKVDPWVDPLRSDPRFQSLLLRLNFPD